ncbi:MULTISPECIES: ExbD/TolR family protein [Hymenobacter]|uniref:Biopolymer transporter ExbD n=2 Tax=Hymenobacter TaxID=89966 RepID=A0ABS6X3D2_9BACT|nr:MULTISPECIES: biopolymer transporter ExbD [Hymenobacter]MBO3270380.1 biopolymer transporter ExbD [Hymenobacter defluvii]MBW3129992.1 biopolymer transporter ExbD [Hymenobacter profundi]QNE41620.1 biopolymer transporter ExbD [Hymenobacter sp. NBH84]
MAEIQQKADSGGGGKKRAKKMSTKIDMTPMVDLAFLLLTFFMLTSTFSKPTVMELNMPAKIRDEREKTELKASNAFTVLLGGDNKIYYYDGLLDNNVKPDLKSSDFSADGIRKVLFERKQRNPNVVVMIKPDDTSTYKNMVDILDEMNITGQKKYALMEISTNDQDLIKGSGL